MEILFILGIFMIGYSIGYLYAIWKVRSVILDVAKKEGINVGEDFEVKEKPKTVVRKLEIEAHGDVLYLFDRENHDFICQGSSMDEVAKLSKEYKNISAATVVYDKKVYMFLNGNSQEFRA